MFSSATALLLAAAGASLVSATAVPTSPDSTTVAAIGSTLKTMWQADTTGTWTDMTIQLMTGDNFQMVPLTTLTTGIDATTATEYSFTVPEVTPTSAIYFLQFHPASNMTDVQWTTRFTISGADGSVTEPTNSTQPGGASIPWGTGKLVAGSATNNTAGAATTVPASSSVVVTATSVVPASSTVSVVSTATTTQNVIAPPPSGMASSMSSSSSATTQAAAATPSAGNGNTSGASQVVGGSLGAALVGLVGFAFMA